MPPVPEQRIQWDKVTWYSKTLAVLLFVILVCGAFYFGIWYQQQNTVLVVAQTQTPTEQNSSPSATGQSGDIASSTNPCSAPQELLVAERAALINEPEFAIGISVYNATYSSCFILVRTIEVWALEEDYESAYMPVAETYYLLYQVPVPLDDANRSQPTVLAYCDDPQAPGDNQPTDDPNCGTYMQTNSPATADDSVIPTDISMQQFDHLLQSLGFNSNLPN